MGGRVGDALAIVDLLLAEGVHATIFMTGAMADNRWTEAGRQVLATIRAHPTALTIGNHSYSHPDFRTLDQAEMREELMRAEAALTARCSVSPRPLFRPPEGGVDANVLAGVGAAGYAFTIKWDVDTIDWKLEQDGGPSADQIVAKVLDKVGNGSIVLMHAGGYNTYAALPRILTGLQARGFQLVTVRELLGLG